MIVPDSGEIHIEHGILISNTAGSNDARHRKAAQERKYLASVTRALPAYASLHPGHPHRSIKKPGTHPGFFMETAQSVRRRGYTAAGG
jgi:hypothetical protein